MGSHQQTRRKKAPANKNTKMKRKTIPPKEGTLHACNRYEVYTRYPTRPEKKRKECVKVSTAGGWRRSFFVQTEKRRKEGPREREQLPGGGGDLSAKTSSSAPIARGTIGWGGFVRRARGLLVISPLLSPLPKRMVGFRTIIWRVYWTYVR